MEYSRIADSRALPPLGVSKSSTEQHRDLYINKRINWPGLTETALDEKPWTEGQILHEVFSGKSPESALKDRGIPADKDKITHFKTLYDTFQSTATMQSVDQAYTELPFLLDIEGFRVQGFIDLLIHNDSGWAVIDYKSGATEHAEKYNLQMAIYKIAAEAITRGPVNTWLYFTKNNEMRKVEPDTKEFREKITKTCKYILEQYYE